MEDLRVQATFPSPLVIHQIWDLSPMFRPHARSTRPKEKKWLCISTLDIFTVCFFPLHIFYVSNSAFLIYIKHRNAIFLNNILCCGKCNNAFSFPLIFLYSKNKQGKKQTLPLPRLYLQKKFLLTMERKFHTQQDSTYRTNTCLWNKLKKKICHIPNV